MTLFRRSLVLSVMLVASLARAAPKITLPLRETGPMTIELMQHYSFDPLVSLPNLPRELSAPAPDGEYAYYMIQFPGPIRPEWKRSVEKLGGELLWYVPHYAFIARLPVANSDAIAALPEVRWLGPDQPAWKILRGFESVTGLQKLIVVFHYAEDANRLVEELKALGAYDITPEFNAWNKSVKLTIDGSEIPAMARMPGVFWIEPYGEITPDNVDVQWVDQKGYAGVADTSRPIWRHGVTGRSVIVGLTDEQVNVAHDMFRDTLNNTPGPSHRKVVRYFGTQGSMEHGTHTCGTLCGNDAPVRGTSLYDGLAKDSRVIFQYYSSLPTNWDMNSWFARPDSGIAWPIDSLTGRNHSMSLSRKDTYNIYIFTDMTSDQFVWNHRKFLHCNSMGNYGTNQMGHPPIAKDIISVGGTENGTACQTFYTTSSRGPTSDGRRKPVLISPADNVISALYSNPSGYEALSGTSMAAPNMTASTALIRDYFRKGFYPTGDTLTGSRMEISAALNKAVAVVGADNSMTGYTVPDNNIGWGRIDLDSSLYFAGDSSRLWVKDDTLGLDTGDSALYTLPVNSNQRPFRVALIWSDYPGTMRAALILVNDLNLTVISPTGIEYKGSVYSGGQSTVGGVYDSLNVEECFRRDAPELGTWTIKVKARNVPQGPQPYSLAAIGMFNLPSETRDVGVSAIVAPAAIIDSGLTIAPACSVFNAGTAAVSYPVRMKIGAAYDTVVTVTNHQPGTVRYVTFPDWVAQPQGMVVVSCSTELNADVQPSNDRAWDSVDVRGPAHDVGVLAILAPRGSIDSGLVATPKARVRNFGSATENFKTRFFIGSAYEDSVTTSLGPLAEDTLQFASWLASPLGLFITRCTTLLASDTNPANNLVQDSVRVSPLSGIETPAGIPARFVLDNADPNPFATKTVVRYGLPVAGPVNLRIYSASGKLVYALEGRMPAGYYRLVWSGQGAGRGIYILRLAASGIHLTRKLVKIE